MVLWVNIHGSFVLGLALIGITFVGEALKIFRPPTTDNTSASVISRRSSVVNLALCGILTAAAMLLNPRGFAVLGYVGNLVGSNAVMTLVTEWAPPTIRDTDGKIFFAFLVGCGVVLIYARRRPDLTDMLLFGAFLWLALGAGRNAVWLGFVATPLLVVQAATLLVEPRARASYAGSALLNGVLLGMLALLVALALPWIKPALGLPPSVGALISDETPVQAVAFLRAQPDRPKHLFHTEAYGSYLIWAAPEQPVFVDTRIELYPYDQWRDYINLGQANNTAALIQKYAIDGMLLSTKYQQPLIDALRADGGWVERYHDEQTSYFTKASGP
jgi:hypothetical protein